MENATDLIIIDRDCTENDLGPTLERVSRSNGHLTILLVAAIPPFPVYSMSGTPSGAFSVPQHWQESWKSTCEELEAKAIEMREILQRNGVSGDVKTACCEPAMLDEVVARHAMVCDRAIISSRLREDEAIFRNVLYGLLFKSPVGVMLNSAQGLSGAGPRKIFVGWNTGLPAARALHRALPMLRTAQEVVIAIFDPVMTEYADGEDPGADVARWLSHHGCKVLVQQLPSGGKDIGEAMILRAREVGADLIVMGAYGRSRLRQNILGGTTTRLIDQTELPVFMAH